MDRHVKLSAIMNRYPVTVGPGDTLISAQEAMYRNNTQHLLVVEEERLVGLLTEGDIARHQARTGESLWSSPSDPVSFAMTTRVHSAGPDDSLTEAAARMVSENISCLPVTKFGKAIGLMTASDVLAAEVRQAMEAKAPAEQVAEDIMVRNPITVHPDDRLLDAAARMTKYQVRHLPVINGDGTLVGMLSDRDIRASLGSPTEATERQPSIAAELMHVRDAMSAPVVTVQTDESCSSIARHLSQLRASAVPVIDSEDALVGIVSYVDLLRAFGA